MFLESCLDYFNHINNYLFKNYPSILGKILGMFKVKILKKNKEEKFYLVLMENLYYSLPIPKVIYDLKGSERRRFIKEKYKKDNKNQVLLDTNFLDDFKFPLIIKKNYFDLLISAIKNDTIFFKNNKIIDYSLLLIIVDNFYIKIGIIDYTQKYNLNKKLEHYGKMFFSGNSHTHTIISPENYKERFNEHMEKYFIGI